MHNLLSAQKTGSQGLWPGDLCSICVTKTTQDPSSNPYHELVFLSHSIEPMLWKVPCVLNKDAVTSDLQIAYFVPQGDLCVFALTCIPD